MCHSELWVKVHKMMCKVNKMVRSNSVQFRYSFQTVKCCSGLKTPKASCHSRFTLTAPAQILFKLLWNTRQDNGKNILKFTSYKIYY